MVARALWLTHAGRCVGDGRRVAQQSPLDWPHVRSDDKASRAWTGWPKLVVRYRWAAASVAVAVLAALVFAVTSIQLGAANGNRTASARRATPSRV